MKRARHLFFCLAQVALLGACGSEAPTSTNGIATSELSLQVLAESDGFKVTLRLGIYALGHDQYARLLLDSGERLVAHVDGAADVELVADSSFVPSYLGTIVTNARTIRIDLVRPLAASALGTEVTLPDAFAIELPPASIQRTNPFTLRWGPPSETDPLKLSLGGPCLSTVQRTLATDTGTFTWSVADWSVPPGHEPESCPVLIELERDGGTIRNADGLAPIQLFRSFQVRRLTLIASPS